MTSAKDMTPEQRAELFAFSRSRIAEDRDRALKVYENKAGILDTAEADCADPERDPEKFRSIYFPLLMAAGYRDHPDYNAAWDEMR